MCLGEVLISIDLTMILHSQGTKIIIVYNELKDTKGKVSMHGG